MNLYIYIHTHTQTFFSPFTILRVKSLYKIKVNLTLKNVKQAMKAYRGIEIQLYSFLTLALVGCGWSTPQPGRFNPGKDPILIV